MNGNKTGIHVFSVNGWDLAYDGATGSLHKCDPVGKAVLEWVGGNPSLALTSAGGRREVPPELLTHCGDRFHRPDIDRAWEDFLEMRGSTLYGRDDTVETSWDPYTPWVKALCLNVAHDCNLACRYCFAGLGRFGGNPQLMTPETAVSAIEFAIRASGPRRFIDVDFFGGEPLLAFDSVVAAIDYAKNQGAARGKVFRFTLTTNCVLLDQEKLDFLNREGVSLILSLDGRPEVHDAMRPCRGGGGSHAVALANAKRAVESRGGRDYYVRGTYTVMNLDFDRDARYLYEQGFRRISLEPAVGEDYEWSIREVHLPQIEQSYGRLTQFWDECRDRGDPLEFYHFDLGLRRGVCKERRVTGCGAGYEYLAVTPSGELYTCHQLVGNPDHLLGDIRDGIRAHDLPKALAAARVTSKTACSDCWARYLCGGGCHARALAVTGDLLRPDPLTCLITKKRLEFALYAEAKRVS
ncbi:MAG TPA: thioether cross-link-forming SCIFF peptide maturase [Firmicutes bacterium]|nr:thioether cross-link-forming SCIFF peptide maturase [Candidatus Fermentithermobacillaceae bacterium]